MSTATHPPISSQDSPDRGQKMRIVVLDDIAEEGLRLLEAAEGIEFDIRTGLQGEELRNVLNEYDGAVCRSGVQVTAESLEGNQSLKAIVRAGVGTDNIDKVAATRLGIVVMNTPAGNTVSTAEHTMALMLGLSRNVAPAFASLQAGKWDRKRFQGSQLAGKTLGVVGLGRIGQEVTFRAQAFGMQVIGFDPFLSQERAEELGITKVARLDELLPEVDYLTVHTPLTPETRGLIGVKELDLLKPGVRLINCARGGIYDHAALLQGLESGKIGGVALDVYPDEPCTDDPLFQRENVLCTPHLGASTNEAQIGVAVEAVELLVNYLTTGEIRSAVNAISLDPKTLKALRYHLDVAHRLGLLLGQWHGGAIESCELQFFGDIADLDTRALVSAFCVGLIGPVADNANFVNAETLCRERGIEITRQSCGEHGVFNNVIAVTVRGEGRSCHAAGTLFGRHMPRLVKLNDYQTESYLDGKLLLFHHVDVPGIIGYVGSLLAEANVNIAQMAVGRSGKQGGAAIGMLNVDNEIPEDVLHRVMENQAIESAKLIQLPEIDELPDWLS